MKLDQVFNEFIHVVQENPDYILGLLNKKGEIVFCSVSERIGEQINIHKRSTDNRIYEIVVTNTHYGYLWIKGPDQAIGMVGSILFDSLKTRIQYEVNQKSAKESLSVDDQLIKELLKENHSNYQYIAELMEKINFDSRVPRIPIYIVNKTGFDRDEITSLKYKINERKTIYSLLSRENLLIFKAIAIRGSNRQISDSVNLFIQELIEWGLSDCYYAVGSIQLNTDLYHFSYQNCLWLKDNVAMLKDCPVYFEDHFFSCLASKPANSMVAHTFDYYKRQAAQINIEEFIQIVEQLCSNDFSIKKTAETLFLHKNTLLYKIKRYEEIFNISIRGSFQGKVWAYYLANILKNEKSRKQVGVK